VQAIELCAVLGVLVVPGGLQLAVPGVLALPVFSLIPGVFGPYVPLALPKARGQQAIANAVLLASSTMLLAVLVNATLAASRRGRLVPLYVGELAVLLVVDACLRAVVRRRSSTSRRPPVS
jgi:hypothetical protein